jgi:hypothetical protein
MHSVARTRLEMTMDTRKSKSDGVFTSLGYKFRSNFIHISLLMDVNLYPTGLFL